MLASTNEINREWKKERERKQQWSSNAKQNKQKPNKIVNTTEKNYLKKIVASYTQIHINFKYVYKAVKS